MNDFRSLRESMVERQIAGRGIDDERLLQAMGEVPRERFVPERLREFAYEDSPLPIAAGQTISQPYIVAAMIDALDLEPDDTVLEVGVGSGYAAAVMSRMCAAVYGVERHAELAESAQERFRDLGYDNVHVRCGDGTLGWPEHAPYDAGSVAAAGPDVPQPLLDQLAVGGRLVIPVGSQRAQELVRIVRRGDDDYERQELGGVRFVPLIGAAGWTEEGDRAEAGSSDTGGSANTAGRYLERVDPEAAEVARARYGCLTPWEQDPALYGRAALSGEYRSCEEQVVAALQDLLERRMEYAAEDGERFLDAEGNARVVADAERYYRVMYYGSRESWNHRDRHMFQTLQRVLDFRSERQGRPAKAVVWEHNSHLGDAAATEMGARGEINVGHLCRQHFGDDAYAVGFGTDHGTVAAAANWGDAMQVMDVRPSLAESYERVCHDTGLPAAG